MFKIGIIVAVLCQLFLGASSKYLKEASHFIDVTKVQEQLTDEAMDCEFPPDDPDYAGLIGDTLGLFGPVGSTIAWGIKLGRVMSDVNNGAEFYGCNYGAQLKLQYKRVLAQVARLIAQNDAQNAFDETDRFFKHLLTYGDSSLSLQGYSTVEATVTKGEAALLAAWQADILGAEMLAEVAIYLVPIQLILIAKTPPSGCDPKIKQLLYNNIDDNIKRLESYKKLNDESQGDLECTPDKEKRQGANCKPSECVCESRGKIVYNIKHTNQGPAYQVSCVKKGMTCQHRFCYEICVEDGCVEPYDTCTEPREMANKEFEEKSYAWWHGSNDPNDKGIQFYLERLKELRDEISYEKAMNQCGELIIGPTSSPVPTSPPVPVPTRVPTSRYCIPSGHECQINYHIFTPLYHPPCQDCCSGKKYTDSQYRNHCR